MVFVERAMLVLDGEGLSGGKFWSLMMNVDGKCGHLSYRPLVFVGV